MKWFVLFLLILVSLVNAIDVYPDKIRVFTPYNVTNITIEVFNDENKPIRLNVNGVDINLAPKKIEKVTIPVKYGENLRIGNKEVKIEWHYAKNFIQYPSLDGIHIPSCLLYTSPSPRDRG